MANLLDLIKPNTKNKLEQLHAEFHSEEERARVEAEKIRIKNAIKYREERAFKNIEEVLTYLKSKGYVFFACHEFSWDPSKIDKPIIWTHQVSDEYDAVFWYEKTPMTIDEFKLKFDKGLDEYGYLYGFLK